MHIAFTNTHSLGEYSCARVKLNLKREYSYYLIQLYIPSLMLVVVSWVSFWLDKDAVPARVSLGVTTLLTMTTQASGINSKLPPVSYIKAVDVWIGSCLAFIFSALLEYALVNYCGRREFVKKEKGKAIGGLLNFPVMPSPNDCICPPPLLPLTPYNVGGGEQLKEVNNNNCYTTDETTALNNFNNFSSIRLDTTCLSSNVTGSGQCHNAAFTARPPPVPGLMKSRPPTGSSFSSAIRKRRPVLCPLRCPTMTRLELSKRVDITSRFTFPALFFLFLVFYYLVYVYNNELMHADELMLKL